MPKTINEANKTKEGRIRKKGRKEGRRLTSSTLLDHINKRALQVCNGIYICTTERDLYLTFSPWK